jgi:hypothetical protein
MKTLQSRSRLWLFKYQKNNMYAMYTKEKYIFFHNITPSSLGRILSLNPTYHTERTTEEFSVIFTFYVDAIGIQK